MQHTGFSHLAQGYTSIESFFADLISLITSSQSTPATFTLNEDDADDWAIPIPEYVAHRHLLKSKNRKCGGSDSIPNKIYSYLVDAIVTALTRIFRSSMAQRQVPALWKNGIISPIPKSQPPKLSDLRQITLLPSPSKILEKIVVDSMRPLFCNAYGVAQLGFRSHASTTTASVAINDELTPGIR